MFKVAICEDELYFSEQIGALLDEYFGMKGTNYQIDYFESGEELMKANLNEYQVFCLDVDLNSAMSGLDVAQLIRRNKVASDIIFITSHQEEAYRAFEVNAFRYLLKPVKKDVLFKTMDLIMRKREEREKRLMVLNLGQKYFQIACDSIIYFETVDRKLRVYTTKKTYMVDNKINEVDKMLADKNFFRVHKSYLINLSYVQEHDQTTVTMLNGDVVYISRLKLKAFKEKFVTFLRKEHRLGLS